MAFRTVVISKRAKLDLKMNYMVVRQVDQTIKVYIDEITMLIIESQAVSLTAALLSSLTEHKVKVIFCDKQRNPISEVLSLRGSFDTSGKIKKQITWKDNTKALVWTEIVRHKIQNQASVLEKLELTEHEQLKNYANSLMLNDETNREAYAAKVYFNALFGKYFSRTQDNPINSCLNYGYGILLSIMNREIVSSGYLTQLGIFHDNFSNDFNLGSDLMEPFRPIVDWAVVQLDPKKFEHDEKMAILDTFNDYVEIEGRMQTIYNAAHIYCLSVFSALNDADLSNLRFYKSDL